MIALKSAIFCLLADKRRRPTRRRRQGEQSQAPRATNNPECCYQEPGPPLPSHAMRHPDPVWLWCSDPAVVAAEDLNRLWQMFLRRFDLEHTFRLFKQTLGWCAPKIRSPEAADRWTWLVLVAHTQLRLARALVEDLRRPWERPAPPTRLTPARVRRGFPRIHRTMTSPAGAPKPFRPGPGRPPGSKNTRPAPHHHVGKHFRNDAQETAGISQAG